MSLAMMHVAVVAGVPYVTEPSSYGTAFGVAGCVLAFSHCTHALLNGVIIDSLPELDDSYQRLSFFYMSFASVSCLLAGYVFFGPFTELDQSFHTHEDK